MDKNKKIIIGVVVFVVAFIIGFVIAKPLHHGENNGGQEGSNQESKLEAVSKEEDLLNIVTKIYDGVDDNILPMLETTPVPVSEADTVKMFTGLNNGDELEYIVVSQPMMNAQAYSLVIAKVKDGVNANDVARKMCEQVDTRRWICVEAEKVCSTNSGNIVCMVMSDEEKTDAVYNSFKKVAGGIGKEHSKTSVQEELPPDMY